MKVVILAGGKGTRLQEETTVKPKPMVEIGGRPILWHIMKHYASHGMNDFVVALGYQGEVIKRYFLERHSLAGHMTIDYAAGTVQRHDCDTEDWRVHLRDTGLETNTGGRIHALEHVLRHDTFMITYGDGVADVDVTKLLEFHKSHGRLATVTAVRPPARFGGLVFDGDLISDFTEKPQTGEGWINGGFMVCEPGLFDYLQGETCSLESHALERVAADGQLAAYRHAGFWQCMDTLRDKNYLENLWQQGTAPWKTWNTESSGSIVPFSSRARAA